MMAKRLATYATIQNNTNKWWFKDAGLRLNVFYCIGSMLCPFYLGYDQSLLTGLQSLPEWVDYFNDPSGDWLGLIAACIFLPGIVVGFPAAWVANSWGRRWCIIIGAIIIIVGGIFMGLCTSTHQFMGARVVMGVGGAMTKVAAPSLVQETAHPRLRSPMGHMYYGFYYLGSLLSAIMCIIGLYIPGEWSWRAPTICCIVGPALVVMILIGAPESPRVMVSKGQNEKAFAMLAKYHANGDMNDPLVKWEFNEINAALEEESLNNKTSYLDFLRTKGNRKRLFINLAVALGVNWAGNGIVGYYLTPALKMAGITKPMQLVSINAGLAAWNLIIAEIAGLNVERYGRRTLFLISTAGMMLSYCFVMGFSAGFAETKTVSLGIASIPFLFFFFGFYGMAWTPLNYSYCVEIMPFNLRTKGTAIYQTTQSIANAFNQFINPIALDAIAWKYYAVYVAIDFLYFWLIYFTFPETKDLSIEEVSLVFDYNMRDGRKMAREAMEARIQGDGVSINKNSPEHLETRASNSA